MTSHGAHAGRLKVGRGRPRLLLVARLVALVRAPTLDQDLADGVRPSASLAHRLRADHLTQPRVRRNIAAALARAVADADRPVRRTAQVPLSREAIRCCERELRGLADALLVERENPRAQGVAIAFRLAFDGGGALFLQPETRHARERLANTVQAALSALRVSAEFDEHGP